MNGSDNEVEHWRRLTLIRSDEVGRLRFAVRSLLGVIAAADPAMTVEQRFLVGRAQVTVEEIEEANVQLALADLRELPETES